MKSSRFVIIIPTLNRMETLEFSIKACLNQKYKNFEILISDNCSDGDVKCLVDSFKSEKINYIKTPYRMNMTDHWNYIFESYNFKDSFVTILGDDDGLAKNSLCYANKLLVKFNQKALTWNKAEYCWPNCTLEFYRDVLVLPLSKSVILKKSSRMLNKLFNFETSYNKLPCIYNSFIHSSVFSSIEKKNRCYFKSASPDVYSSIVISSELSEYIYTNIPISVNGASAYSNGIRNTQALKDDNKVEDFKKVSIKHSELEWDCFVSTAVMDALLKSNDDLNLGYNINRKKYFESCVDEMKSKHTKEALSIGYHFLSIMAKKYSLSLNDYILPEQYQCLEESLDIRNRIVYGLSGEVLILDAKNFGVYNIESACQLVSNITSSYSTLDIEQDDLDNGVHVKNRSENYLDFLINVLRKLKSKLRVA